MRQLRSLVFALSLSAAACGSDSKSGPGPDGGSTGGTSSTGGGPGAGGTSNGGSATGGAESTGGSSNTGGTSTGGTGTGGSPSDHDGGGEWSTTTILSRPSRGTHVCTVQRDRTSHVPRIWFGNGHALAATRGGQAFLARVEAQRQQDPPWETSASQFLVSKFGADGGFGSFATPSAGDPAEISAPALASRGDGLALVWVEGATLRFAALDAEGAVVAPAKDLPSGPVDVLSGPRIVAGKNGEFGVSYVSTTIDGDPGEIRLLVLGEDGSAKNGSHLVKALPPSNGYYSTTNVVAADDGYALVWTEREGSKSDVFFGARNADGSERMAAHKVSIATDPGVSSGAGTGFDRSRIALLPSSYGFAAAWTEVHQQDGGDVGKAYSVIQLAQLGRDGELLHDPVTLRDKAVDIDEVEPSLTQLGDALAVQWARGDHIYICGGCTPDHRIDVLLVDPTNFDPLSDVVSIQPPTATAGGLLTRESVVLGSTILLAFEQTYHTSANPGSAAFNCAKR